MKNPKQKLTIGTWRFPLISGKARVKQFEVQQTADGLVLKQRLTGGIAEMFQGSKQKPDNTIRLSVPSVFGKPKVLTIGADWVKIGDRIFRADTSGKKGTGP